jgi:hypothetical protein
MQKGNEFRVHVRRVFKRIFYVLLDRLKIRRFGDHFPANPALADPLKKTFAGTDVLHAALIGGNNRDRVTFTRSTQLESSSIFREWAAAKCGDQWKFRQPSLQAPFES